ncbi:asparaginase [Streptomyces sp. NPDC020875]|uniref:asparaginase n=1 Tax=Streptomyces sp. NPDC020875 TaxID=3154898 RepID=UPI0033C563C4
MSDRSSRPVVLVLSLGGTIAMTRIPGEGGAVPRLTAADLLGAVPDIGRFADLVAEDVSRLPGASLPVETVVEVAGRIRAAESEGVAGVVITQGTDTLEETAWLLDLLYGGPLPVVLTGAMRNPSLPGADGPANLLAAVQTAAAPGLRGVGAVVVFADEIHTARRVRKIHSSSVAAFASPGAGPVGHIVEGAPRLFTTPPRTPAVPTPAGTGTGVRVEVVTAALGSTGVLLEGLEERVDGLVVAAFGAGHVPADWVPQLERITGRIPVVLASRTGSGSTLSGTYAFPGSESDLLARGLIGAGTLDPLKARLLLLALLAGGADRAGVAGAFPRYR